MIQMLSCFNLQPQDDIESFHKAYLEFLTELKLLDLVYDTGPLGKRENDTPMDTDNERHHQFFVLMRFRDRLQMDLAYAHIEQHTGTTDKTHNAILGKVRDPIFICWREIQSPFHDPD